MDEFVRDYTAGVDSRGLKRLFDKDAVRAYAVLTREQGREEAEPKGEVGRFFYRIRLAFLGLSYKLTPARRMLFAVSLIAFLLGLFDDPEVVVRNATTRWSVDFSPFWFLVSLLLMVYLLALELVDRVRVRDELEVARELQADLLPNNVPPVPGYDFAHSYRTANEVGGDYYDLTPLPDGRVALMVGDASGHGMAAGLVMAIANATLKTALDLDPSPHRVLTLLNRTLCRTGNKRTFMSVFYALLDPQTGDMDFVCAGHPFPLLRRADGTVEELGCGGLPLGMREPLELAPQSVQIRSRGPAAAVHGRIWRKPWTSRGRRPSATRASPPSPGTAARPGRSTTASSWPSTSMSGTSPCSTTSPCWWRRGCRRCRFESVSSHTRSWSLEWSNGRKTGSPYPGRRAPRRRVGSGSAIP